MRSVATITAHYVLRLREHVRCLWIWLLLVVKRLTVMELDSAFPTETQASAVAPAFAKLVTRAGKPLSAPTLGSLIQGCRVCDGAIEQPDHSLRRVDGIFDGTRPNVAVVIGVRRKWTLPVLRSVCGLQSSALTSIIPSWPATYNMAGRPEVRGDIS